MVRSSFVTLAVATAIGTAPIGGQTAGQDGAKYFVAVGTVKAVSRSALTLERNGGNATFAIIGSTRLVGKGMASDLVWREGGRPITDIVKPGDRVKVTFRTSAEAATAVRIRVMQRDGK